MLHVTHDPEQSRSLLTLSRAALARGDRKGAIEAIEAARRFDSFDDEIPLLGALIHLDYDEPARAALLTLEAIAARPFHPAAWNLLGVACFEAGETALAARVLERAVRMAPGLSGAAENLGECRREAAGRKLKRPRAVEGSEEFPCDAIRALLEERSPRLTACVLVRDGEEPQLRECLESLRGFASELLWIDSRSGGGERDLPADPIVRALPVRSSDERATQRNMALQHARGDWLLLLDADECLAPGSVESLRRAMSDARSLAHALELRGARGARRGVRLVRNAPGVRFLAPFDDDLLPSLLPLERKWSLAVASSHCALVRGERSRLYPEPRTRQELRLALERLCENELLGVRAELGLAGDDMEGGALESALERVRRARAVLDADPHRRRPLELEEPTVLEGRCLMRLERWEELAQLMSRYHECFPATCATLFLEGCAAKALGRAERAIERLEAALELELGPSFATLPPEAGGAAMANLIGAAWLDRGDLARAAEAFTRAVARDPANLEARLGRMAIRHAAGEIEEVLRDLDRLIESNGENPRVWLAGAIFLGQSRDLDDGAVAWLREARVRFPAHAEIRQRLGEALLRRGDAELALDTLADLAAPEPALEAARIAAALACGGSLPALDVSRRDGVAAGVLAWFGRWMQHGAFEALDRALLDIPRAEGILPGLGGRTAAWLESIGQGEAAAGVRARL